MKSDSQSIHSSSESTTSRRQPSLVVRGKKSGFNQDHEEKQGVIPDHDMINLSIIHFFKLDTSLTQTERKKKNRDKSKNTFQGNPLHDEIAVEDVSKEVGVFLHSDSRLLHQRIRKHHAQKCKHFHFHASHTVFSQDFTLQ